MHSSYLTVHNYFNLNSEMDSGDILSVSYTKTFPQTALRLTATGDHRMIIVSGICYGISSGEPHSITYAVAGCNGQDPDAHTAWQSSFNIFIEELWLEERKTCSGTPIDCDV
ncbi:hypothetical protein EB796_015208 [Bugula neritina]|uniref:CTHRC1 C-terminal domain-containing protein n=1 Tax=Bugula neritina TaxID=10212 RepID=A0A7J7JLI1_BUGNE|nr:hypothetical protein EB796_015208 [Bugula neritina]